MRYSSVLILLLLLLHSLLQLLLLKGLGHLLMIQLLFPQLVGIGQMGLRFLRRWVVKGLFRGELSISIFVVVVVVIVVGGGMLHLRGARSGHRVVSGVVVAVFVETGICACKSERIFSIWVSKRCCCTSGNSRSCCWHCSSWAPISMLVGAGHLVCLLLLGVVAVVVSVTIVVTVVALGKRRFARVLICKVVKSFVGKRRV
jgi:hypothetical protein